MSINDFKIIKKIGVGAFGKVYLANGNIGNVAIKRVKMSNHAKSSIEQEINNHKLLKHPNIVCLYRVFELHPHVYMIMEYVDSPNLYNVLFDGTSNDGTSNSGTLDDGTSDVPSSLQRVGIILQLIKALIYCHSQYVMHRDIKMENILYCTQTKVVKLIDFGLSCAFIKPLRPTYRERCGTCEYQSPEIVAGKPYDERVDIWAVGILYYELITGITPFDSDTRDQTGLNIIEKNPIKTLDFSNNPDDWTIITLMLEKDMLKRTLLPELKVMVNTLYIKYIEDLKIQKELEIKNLQTKIDNAGCLCGAHRFT